ncbi:hypothetical protein OOT46_25970 [Aquabacterium sp. A7-Y]|uniref:hypothetical protein n=1 Tax=Aquabacterium sp. A7-Y TaxID=1349605 RepID=UPI00223DA96B|nr:hypothetical protein [Aquabacterium sp. A7-Y]MCW7541262.1 hypothetical protein [Aquabacterium sp. A7-Y]
MECITPGLVSTAEIKQMTHNRIVALLAANGVPPEAVTICSSSIKHRFAPLSESGALHTIDSAIWHKARPPSAHLSYTFCPCAEEAQAFVDKYKSWNSCLVGLTSGDFKPLGREGLIDLAPLLEPSRCTFLGYDVIDTTGLSALTNVGSRLSRLQRCAKALHSIWPHRQILRCGKIFGFGFTASSRARTIFNCGNTEMDVIVAAIVELTPASLIFNNVKRLEGQH